MKTVLITGIAGFLGSHVAEHLLANGWNVFGIDDFSGGCLENIPKGVSGFLHGDITDAEAVELVFNASSPSAVVHCAAFASENLSHHCRAHAYKSVVLGSANVVNACVNHGVKVLVSMSSIAVYGAQLPPFTETMNVLPEEPYGAAKSCMEADLHSAKEHFGLDGVIFRPHNLIGLRQNRMDTSRNVASIFIRQALSGNPMTIFGDGNQTRAWSPVSSVAKVIAASLDRPVTWNKTFNIGGDQVMTVNRLAHLVQKLTGSKAGMIHLPDRNEVVNAFSDHEAVRRAFPGPYCGPQSIEDCLGEMVQEALAMPVKALQPLPRIEITKNLPSAWTSKPLTLAAHERKQMG